MGIQVIQDWTEYADGEHARIIRDASGQVRFQTGKRGAEVDLPEFVFDANGNLLGVRITDTALFPLEQTLLQSAAAISVTGTTAEVVVAKKTIPAGFLQPGDTIVIRFLGSSTNNANTKTFSVRAASTELWNNGVTTASTQQQELNLYVRDNTTIVAGNQYGGPSYGNAYAGSVIAVLSGLNLAANPLPVDIRLKLGTGTDTITLEAFSISVRRAVGVNEA